MVELEVAACCERKGIEADQGTWVQNKIIQKSEVKARISKYQKKNKEPMCFIRMCMGDQTVKQLSYNKQRKSAALPKRCS